MTEHLRMLINGEWVSSGSQETIDVTNPDNAEVYATVPAATLDDVRQAIDTAHAAQSGWARRLPQDRAQILFHASRLVEEQADALTQTLVNESGSTLQKATYEVRKSVDYIRARGEEIFRLRGETLPSQVDGKFSMSIRQPKGVVAAISPWNFPLILSIEKVASALACGNTVVLKPATDTPCTLLKVAEIFLQAGLPPGAFNLVTGRGSAIGDELVTNAKVSHINFTGSTEVGRRIAEVAGRHLKKVTLELGGKNPLLILNDADLETASSAACYGAFFHSGQICIAVGRIIVEDEVFEAFTEKFVNKARKLVPRPGALMDPSTILSPLTNQGQLRVVRQHVEDAVEKGATVLTGGGFEGLYHEATVLTDVTANMLIYGQETFGPAVPILRVSSLEEAISVANDTEYGLSSGVFTRDVATAFAVAERLEAGMVHINDSPFYADQECAPLGGVKASGLGTVGSHYSLEEGTEIKWVTVQKTPRAYPV